MLAIYALLMDYQATLIIICLASIFLMVNLISYIYHMFYVLNKILHLEHCFCYMIKNNFIINKLSTNNLYNFYFLR